VYFQLDLLKKVYFLFRKTQKFQMLAKFRVFILKDFDVSEPLFQIIGRIGEKSLVENLEIFKCWFRVHDVPYFKTVSEKLLKNSDSEFYLRFSET
jgi:hypothetical protein